MYSQWGQPRLTVGGIISDEPKPVSERSYDVPEVAEGKTWVVAEGLVKAQESPGALRRIHPARAAVAGGQAAAVVSWLGLRQFQGVVQRRVTAGAGLTLPGRMMAP